MIKNITLKNRKNSKCKFETCLILTEHALKMINPTGEYSKNLEAFIDYLILLSKSPQNVQVEILYQHPKQKKNAKGKNFRFATSFPAPVARENDWKLKYDSLTGQEGKVFSFILRNFKQQQICRSLNIKLNTEKGYRKTVHQKMQVADFAAINDQDRDLLLRFTHEK